MSILLAFFRSAAHTRARKPLGDIAFLLLARPADVAISSQPRYDHFDTAAYSISLPAQVYLPRQTRPESLIEYPIFIYLSILQRKVK